jgi:hypothetical protein
MTQQQDRNAVGRKDTAGGHNVSTVDDLLVISVRDREIRNQASFTNTPCFVSARVRVESMLSAACRARPSEIVSSPVRSYGRFRGQGGIVA